MAELSHEETIRLGNSKAHLHKIMSDVNDANNIISALLSIKGDIENKIAALNTELQTLEQDKQVILDAHSQSLSEVNATAQGRIDEADRREGEMAAVERNHMAKVRDLVTLAQNTESQVRVAQATLESLKAGIKNAETDLAGAELAFEAFDEQLDSLHDRMVTAQAELAETTRVTDDIRDEFRKEKAASQKELDYLKGQIELARQAVQDPTQKLQEREDVIAKREEVFEVMAQRMQQVHAAMYPGRTLKI